MFPLAAAPYVLAAIVWTVPSPSTVGARADRPHRFMPATEAWRSDALPLGHALHASTVTADVGCLVCRAGPDDPRHSAPEA